MAFLFHHIASLFFFTYARTPTPSVTNHSELHLPFVCFATIKVHCLTPHSFVVRSFLYVSLYGGSKRPRSGEAMIIRKAFGLMTTVIRSMLDIALHLGHHVCTGDCHRSKLDFACGSGEVMSKPHHVTCLLWWSWLGIISAYFTLATS